MESRSLMLSMGDIPDLLIAALLLAPASLVVLRMAQLVRRNRWLSTRVEQVGPRLVPWVMVGVGLYVLANSTTDLV